MGNLLSVVAPAFAISRDCETTAARGEGHGVSHDAMRPQIWRGEVEAATGKFVRVLPDLELVLGPHHASTITAKDHLATLNAWRMRLEGADGPHVQRLTATEPKPGTRSISMGEDNAVMAFNWDIKLVDAAGTWVHATALLDTQCHVGNWVSMRLVQRLGRAALVSTDFEPPEVVEASGRPVRACGVIDLTWKWHPRGTCIYECRFYVLPDSDHLDIIFGVESIVGMNLVQANTSAVIPLMEHKKLKKGEKAAIARAEERQRQEKAALAERRKQQSQQREQQHRVQHGQHEGERSSN